MHEGETVWVEAPAPHGTCVWCGEAFEDAGDFRCIAMLTKDEDGDASVRTHMHNSIVEALTRFGSLATAPKRSLADAISLTKLRAQCLLPGILVGPRRCTTAPGY